MSPGHWVDQRSNPQTEHLNPPPSTPVGLRRRVLQSQSDGSVTSQIWSCIIGPRSGEDDLLVRMDCAPVCSVLCIEHQSHCFSLFNGMRYLHGLLPSRFSPHVTILRVTLPYKNPSLANELSPRSHSIGHLVVVLRSWT